MIAKHRRPQLRTGRARSGVSVILVLALLSMTLALSYAMLRTQATVEQTARNSNHRSTARQAAMTGMSVALRSINEPNWSGVEVNLSGDLGDGSTYSVAFETGDQSLQVSDPDYAEYPYRLTITATGRVIDPANPQIQATHQIRSIVQLVRRKMSDAPSNWSTIKPYTVYQWGTGSGREMDIESPLHIAGPVYAQNRINYLVNYPNDGDDKPFDGSIDEVMILGESASSSVIEAIHDGTLTLQTLASVPEANAVAWWRFDEAAGNAIAMDSLGTYNGRYEGSTAGGSPCSRLGSSGAAVFDGFDDHVDVGSVNVSGSRMTILAWIKADDFDCADARILSKATGVNDSDHFWMLSTIDVSGHKRLRFRLKTDFGGTDVLQASSGDLTTNTWTFVAAVYDGLRMRLYKDGQLVGWRFKLGSIGTSSTARASIGNNPSGSPRARLLRDFEAMRVAGQGDFRPFSGPVNAPLSLTSDRERRLLESDSNVKLNNISTASGTAPVTHPGNVTSYRLYPGGRVYSPTQLSTSISNVSFAPNVQTNPLGLVKCQSQLVVNNNVTIQGTLLVYDAGSSGRVELRGTGIKIAPLSLPSLYGDSTVYQLPSVIARDDVEVYSKSSSSLGGLVMAWDDLQCFQGKQSTEMSVTGQVIAGELQIEARDEWDQSSSWWDSRHKEFLAQLGTVTPIVHFPAWLQANHGLDYQPKLTIQPDPSNVSYHWHDWSKPLFEAHPADGGLRWNLLEWRDGN